MGPETGKCWCVNIQFVGLNIIFDNIPCIFCSQSYQDILKSLTVIFIIFMLIKLFKNLTLSRQARSISDAIHYEFCTGWVKATR